MLAAMLAIGISSQEVRAQAPDEADGNFGLGIMIGEPTGISVKSWLSETTAFDIGAAWSLAGSESLHMHADFLWHSWLEGEENLAAYYGVGARVIFADDPTAGIRVPVGLNYVFEDIPFDLFVEAVPIIEFDDGAGLAGNGAVGMRYYF